MSEADVRQDTLENRVDLVEDLFHGTGESYDRIANMATFGRDKRWKEELIAHVKEPERVLDLACGTGILLLDLCKRFNCHVTGVELREEYLRICRQRADAAGYDVELVCQNAEDFVVDEQFDHITSCYIPKYINLQKTVPQLLAMLKPGGLIIMQDFSYPKEKWVQDIFDDHFERMSIRCKGMEDWETMWAKLPHVVRNTTWVQDMERLFLEGGLEDVTVQVQTRGMSTLVYGRKPSA